jgi:RHS repeat-associated protein
MFIYTTNESNYSVYFDEVYILHEKTNSALQVTQLSDYYPFGLGFNTWNKESIKANRYLYQKQEAQDDLGYDEYQYKYRMHDPAMGRFLSVDPLSEKYMYNSTYAFSENRVTDGIDLEGLEHVYTLHSATVSASFKNAVLSGDAYEQRRIMSWALSNQFGNSYATRMTFSDAEKPINNQIVSYKFDSSFEGVHVNTTSNKNGILYQDKVGFLFPKFSDGAMSTKNYPVDVPGTNYYGNDFIGNFAASSIGSGLPGRGQVGVIGKGFGTIKDFGFVQYRAELLGEKLTDFSLAGAGLFTGKYSGKAGDSFTNLFGPSLSKGLNSNQFIGNDWKLNLDHADYSPFKYQTIYNAFSNGNYTLNFFKMDMFRPAYYTVRSR